MLIETYINSSIHPRCHYIYK